MLPRGFSPALLLVLAWFANTVSAADMTPDAPQWTRISVSWNNGSLPPPHRRSGTLVLDAGGQGKQVLVKGYQADADNTVTQEFAISAAAVKKLSDQLVDLKAFTTRWHVLDPHPVGGSMRWVQIDTLNGRVEIPPFPIAKQRDRADQIVQAIRAVVPAAAFDAAKTETD